MDIISTDDTIADDLDVKVHTEYILKLLYECLDERERSIIILRYGLGRAPAKTQREIADMMHISRSYVSRIEKKALSKMREQFKTKNFFTTSP